MFKDLKIIKRGRVGGLWYWVARRIRWGYAIFYDILLSRIEKFNKRANRQDIDWKKDWIFVVSDVKSLFPSLSKERISKAVQNQAKYISIRWTNIDTKWLTQYIHLSHDLCSDLKEIVQYYLSNGRTREKWRQVRVHLNACNAIYNRNMKLSIESLEVCGYGRI